MFHFLAKNVLQIRHAYSTTRLLLRDWASRRSYCTIIDPQNPEISLVTYLRRSCGLSSHKALAVTKYIRNKNLHNPDSVVSFLKGKGFSKSQIASMISRRPLLLFSRVQSNLDPKIRFFEGNGLSKSEISELLTSDPVFLVINLDKRIKPLVDFVRTAADSNETFIGTLRHHKSLLRCNLERSVIPNLNLLKECQVPHMRILQFLRDYPRSLMIRADRFSEHLKMVVGMGFKPSTNLFREAVRALGTMSKSTWKAKFDVYKSHGWSEEDICFIFRRHPSSLMISEEKIREGLNYFEKELGWDRRVIRQNPCLLLLSMHRRVIPRYRVLHALGSEGLISMDKCVVKRFLMSEKHFLQKYVTDFQDKLPGILEIYYAGGKLENGNQLTYA